MTEEEKAELLRSLIVTNDFGIFLGKKRNEGELMDAKSSYNLLFEALNEEDLIILSEKNIRFAIITAPAAKFSISLSDINSINLICFEMHLLSKFSKEEVVAIILHEIGHVIHPHLSDNTLNEFQADNYAVNREFGEHLRRALEKGIQQNYDGFQQPINKQRIERLR